jgi:ectoine hydroxylase-related dioxygenase (phytanoyl-CoA dioxygenase family)
MKYEPETWKSGYRDDGYVIVPDLIVPRLLAVLCESKVEVCCPAGSGIFFSPKIIHAAGHNRSDHPRGTLNSVWTGPDVLPTSSARQAYEGLKPRSRNLAYGEQLRMTFPKLIAF